MSNGGTVNESQCPCFNPFDGRVYMEPDRDKKPRECCQIRLMADMPPKQLKAEREKISDAAWQELRPKIIERRKFLRAAILTSRKDREQK